MGLLDDAIGRSKEVDIIKHDVAIFKNLIKQRKHPLDLVRELLSNAGSREVGARHIEVSYTKDKEGHIFEVLDDGCGMDFRNSQALPGRLDRFLGLGLSEIGGQVSDEFSWQGLGSKLAYQSRRVEVETRFSDHPLYEVRINEPWSSLDRNLIPKPRITEHQDPESRTFTRIKVIGHPPHRQEEPFTLKEICTFLSHRTFAGFTKERKCIPKISVSVLGQTEQIEFGFPEFRGIEFPDGLLLDDSKRTLFVNIVPRKGKSLPVRLKGFLTWDAGQFNLHKDNLNTGLILSSRGIPYFPLGLDEYGASGISTANPGEEKVCLVVEADVIHSEMNISRSDLVDSAETLQFKNVLKQMLNDLEGSVEYREFRQLPKRKKQEARGETLADEKRRIESEDQNWVVWEGAGSAPRVLMREPQNESEVNAIVWKLEALDALPFARFQTLGYPGASGGPDLFVNFQEDKASEPIRVAAFEVENNFYSYKQHGHLPSQFPKVICWNIPASGRKARLNKTSKKYKFTVVADEYQIHVYAIKLMDGISVLSTRELRDRGVVM